MAAADATKTLHVGTMVPINGFNGDFCHLAPRARGAVPAWICSAKAASSLAPAPATRCPEYHRGRQSVRASTTRTDRPAEGAKRLLRWTQGISIEDVMASPHALIGTVDSIVEKLAGVREPWGHSHFTVRWPAAESFAPPIARLVGSL